MVGSIIMTSDSEVDQHGEAETAAVEPCTLLLPPSPPSPKPLSAVQSISGNDLSLLDLSSQHQPPTHTALATLASSLGIAKSAFLKSRPSSNSSFDQQRPVLDSSTTSSSFSESDGLTPAAESFSLPSSSVLYKLLSKSSSVVGQSIKSLARRDSQLEEPPDNTDENEDMGFLFEAPPLNPVILSGYSPTTRTRILKPELAEEIRNFVPPRIQLRDQWNLVYSLEQHGASLSTLFHNNEPLSGTRPGYVLVIRDRFQSVFGAYVNEHFRPSELKRFFGNGDCFLWKVVSTNESASEEKLSESSPPGPRFKAFPYTGINDFVIFCTHNFLSLGGGDGHYGLWVDASLERGVSSHSLTFDNEPLSSSGSTKFDIIGLEVWRIS